MPEGIVRIAIITDIHSNLPALEAVLAEIAGSRPDEVWCLGDVVGYGAEPNECAALVADHCSLKLVGNHDLAVTGELTTDVFSKAAAAAVEWTRAHCTEETMSFLKGLEPKDTSREVAAYHASPRDPVWEYVLSTEQASECIAAAHARVSVIGHSHVALHFRDEIEADPAASGGKAEANCKLDVTEGRWLLNPGSVGQPRDFDPRAAWLELDLEGWEATYHRVEYDIDRASRSIRAAGLPALLADRLQIGQ